MINRCSLSPKFVSVLNKLQKLFESITVLAALLEQHRELVKCGDLSNSKKKLCSSILNDRIEKDDDQNVHMLKIG